MLGLLLIFIAGVGLFSWYAKDAPEVTQANSNLADPVRFMIVAVMRLQRLGWKIATMSKLPRFRNNLKMRLFQLRTAALR
ncbi:hypothetical protein AAULR_11820 [Lacticaseibacillus rhamnosus MTCC 5462]|nr:hypothetical protein AAULR_11820 [Lacticaseibacillus rhamnosus MTCC 5462]